jgi:hypothetical protein
MAFNPIADFIYSKKANQVPVPNEEVQVEHDTEYEWRLQRNNCENASTEQVLETKPNKNPNDYKYKTSIGDIYIDVHHNSGSGDLILRVRKGDRSNSFRLKKDNGFSCGVRTVGGIESIYRVFGIKLIEDLILDLTHNFNHFLDEYVGVLQSRFLLFSVTHIHKELVDFFEKNSDFKSEQIKNPNSSNYIAVYGFNMKE